ncbi:hypothetical protein RJ45_08755 [Photobacterium gaetbulicola]|uniref:Lipoprotein n=1 Tax=Photobacterium gaetbulicola TaxID=1295392 RepID=A0A0B9G5H6_9GAMM|nr:hypothetical protein [Photobacterium gaetbulicola]KHT63993.1 hypothetical protein RJ45_08755 [Photobacterium gaetbulicola]
MKNLRLPSVIFALLMGATTATNASANSLSTITSAGQLHGVLDSCQFFETLPTMTLQRISDYLIQTTLTTNNTEHHVAWVEARVEGRQYADRLHSANSSLHDAKCNGIVESFWNGTLPTINRG